MTGHLPLLSAKTGLQMRDVDWSQKLETLNYSHLLHFEIVVIV